MTQGNATERRSPALARHGRDAHIISSKCYMNNRGIVPMVKQIAFHDQALHSMKRGIDVVAGALKFTRGPRGRNVAIDQRFGPPVVSHDGVSIAKAIDLDDPLENLAALPSTAAPTW